MRWRQVGDRVFGRLDAERDPGRSGREDADRVTVHEGRARFTGPGTLRIESADGGHDANAEQVVVAAGDRPLVPGLAVESGLPYETSDTAMRLDAPPGRLAILGVGYIAVEPAEVFAGAGSSVTVIEKEKRLLGPQDETVAGAAYRAGPLPLRPPARPGGRGGRWPTGRAAADPGRRIDGRGGHAARRGGPRPEQRPAEPRSGRHRHPRRRPCGRAVWISGARDR